MTASLCDITKADPAKKKPCPSPRKIKLRISKAFAGFHDPKNRFRTVNSPGSKQVQAMRWQRRKTSPMGQGWGGFGIGSAAGGASASCDCSCKGLEEFNEFSKRADAAKEKDISPAAVKEMRKRAMCFSSCASSYGKCRRKGRKKRRSYRPRKRKPLNIGGVDPDELQ